jgi:hypothetical protein
MPAYRIPAWLDYRPENVSVFDPPSKRVMRSIAKLLGVSDPRDQVAAVMNPMEVGPVEGVVGAVTKAGNRYAKALTGKIRAYHGSPHDFEKFASKNIGTGEGAQAFGHGLYFAEAEKTAQAYKHQLAKPKFETRFDDLNRMLDDSFDQVVRQSSGPVKPADAVDLVEQRLMRQRADALKANDAEWFSKVEDMRAELGRVKKNPPGSKGHMYEVDIHADPDTMLDWDKPLSQQPPAVKAFTKSKFPDRYADMEQAALMETRINALADQYGKPGDSYKDAIARAPESVQREWKGLVAEHSSVTQRSPGQHLPTSGESLYHALSGDDPSGAAAALKEAGIPGIKYLDQGSRQGGEGTSNYVVFDDKLIDVLRKYGLLPPAAAMALKAQQSQPAQTEPPPTGNRYQRLLK